TAFKRFRHPSRRVFSRQLFDGLTLEILRFTYLNNCCAPMTETRMEQIRPTVLAVNDEPKVLELFAVMLERDGYKVVTAENGPRALELALTLEPDIVISDIVMPEMDGLELCHRLKQDPHTAFIPVLLASALRTGKRSNL